MIKTGPKETKIKLYRGGRVITSFLGSFSNQIKETRLTSMIGYLVSLAPEEFIRSLNVSRKIGTVRSIAIENNQKSKRTDIEILTTKTTIIIEAKISYSNPKQQAKKYKGRYKILLTNYMPKPSQLNFKTIKYITWQRFSEIIERFSKSKNPIIKFISQDIINYLEEHNMIKRIHNSEVFIRNINDQNSLNLFLLGHVYGCPFEKSKRREEALYFAPMFGGRVSHLHPGVKKGVSYIAKIESIEIIHNWKELLSTIRKQKGKVWINKNEKLLASIYKKSSFHKTVFSFFLLSKPHLIFNPPIKKQELQAGKGWLSKFYYSFDQLFTAWKV